MKFRTRPILNSILASSDFVDSPRIKASKAQSRDFFTLDNLIQGGTLKK